MNRRLNCRIEVIQCRESAMLDVSAVARVADPGQVRAVEWREDAARDTAPHAHAPGQLIGSLSGLLSVHTPEGWWVVPATHAIWVPPGVVHGVRAHGPFRGWSVYVAPGDCADLAARPRTLRVSGLMRELVHRATGFAERATAAGLRLSRVMIDEIAALPEDALGLPRPVDARLNRVVDALLADLSDARPVDDWATVAGMTPRTLARHFAAETGLSLTQWRQRARALRAIECLAAGQAVTMIALDLGYDNVSAFIAMFRRVMGTTPGQYGVGET